MGSQPDLRNRLVGRRVGGGGPGPLLRVTPTSQVWARRLMAELLRPNMTAKKELRFFCSLRLTEKPETLRGNSHTHRAPRQHNTQAWDPPRPRQARPALPLRELELDAVGRQTEVPGDQGMANLATH